MLKRWLALSIALGFAFSILLPNSFVQAEAEDDDAATEEEADAEEVEDEEATEDDEEGEDESEAPASDEPEDPAIYIYVLSFVVVLGIGMYVFTEGTRKE